MEDAHSMLSAWGFALVAAEGIETQYFVLTARKGAENAVSGFRSYILPGEDWAAAQLVEGWGEAVDHSWRPVAPRSEAVLTVPEGDGLHVFAAAYFWPDPPLAARRLVIGLDGMPMGEAEITAPGDHYFEFPMSRIHRAQGPARVVLDIEGPPETPRPAVRSLGIYAPSRL
jgi:hypothetical protein